MFAVEAFNVTCGVAAVTCVPVNVMFVAVLFVRATSKNAVSDEIASFDHVIL